MFCPQGGKKSYLPQHSASSKAALSACRAAGPAGPAGAEPGFNQAPKKPAETTWGSPYPKILNSGAVESFRLKAFDEKVTHAEPLSPSEPGERGEETWSHQAEPHLEDEVDLFTTSDLAEHSGGVMEKCCEVPNHSDNHVPVGVPAEEPVKPQPHPPAEAEEESQVEHHTHDAVDAWLEEEENPQDSDSETEAVLEPTLESRTGSPESECEAEKGAFNQFEDFSCDDVEIKQERSSAVDVGEVNVEEKLYPDGEEMDTWDSVMERKADLEPEDHGKNEAKSQRAQPEEDLSVRDREERRGDNVAPSVVEAEDVPVQQEHLLLPGKDEDSEEEDSQNVSVSWRTEVESDSYAQDNTLADTRPLIRYTSDEADGRSESSEGDQDKKIGETWSESKSKRFGTMEDLCEEAEGEDDLGYTHHAEDSDVGLTSRDPGPAKGEEMMEHSAEEPEGPTTNLDHGEELETDRLVEQELENLCTDSYSHFAQTEVSETREVLHLQEPPAVGRPHGDLDETLSDEEIQHDDEEAADAPESRDEQDVSMVTDADVDGFLSRPDPPEVEDVSSEPQELLDEDAAGRHSFPETSEREEVLENFGIKEYDKVPECDENMKTQEEPEVSPDCQPEEDLFVVKDSTERLNKKHHDLHDVFSSSLQNDFWAAATHQPADAGHEEPPLQNMEFADGLVWVNGTSVLGAEAVAAEEEMDSETKPVMCRTIVEGEAAHSEESESWSSGEEPV